MKQIGLAVHNYHDTHGHLPPGALPNPALPADQRLSWLSALTPYLEMRATADPAAAWDAGANRDATAAPVKVFRCPAWHRERQSEPSNHTNYLGVAGVGPDAADLPAGDPRAGAFGYARRVGFGDVADGVSSTLYALDSGSDLGPWARGGPGTVRGPDPAARPHLGVGRPFAGAHYDDGNVFRAGRPVGGAAGLLDGSVRELRHTVADAVVERLTTIAGKDPVAPSDW